MDALPKELSIRIGEKLQWFAGQDDSLSFAEPLKSYAKSFYRFRIGDYRAIFYLNGGNVVIVVVAVKHRREAYAS